MSFKYNNCITSQINKYEIILVLISYPNLASLAVFKYDLTMIDSDSGLLFFGPPCRLFMTAVRQTLGLDCSKRHLDKVAAFF